MATAKKPPVKKSTKTTVRAAKKAPAKKKTTTAKVKRSSVASRKHTSFMTMTPTAETVYWLILGALVIILAIWVASLTIKVQNIYNQIEIDNAQNSVMTPTTKHHKQ